MREETALSERFPNTERHDKQANVVILPVTHAELLKYQNNPQISVVVPALISWWCWSLRGPQPCAHL